MDPRRGRLLIAILLALLPGMALAGVGGLRVCLSALAGGGDCCLPTADARGCCSDVPPPAPAEDNCAWCCVELEQGAPIAEVPTRDGPAIVLAYCGVAPVVPAAHAPARRCPMRPRSARPPPDGRFNPPLRV